MATKAKATAKNLNSFQSLIAEISDETKGLLKSSLGTNKKALYKKELFEGLSEKEIKKNRKKLRNVLISFAQSITSEKDSAKLTKLITSFKKFYTSAYTINDYSLDSICNENLNGEKKTLLTKMLQIVTKSNH